MMLTRLFASLALCLICIANADAQQQNKQRPIVPESFSFSHVRDMVWGGNQFVAVGKNGLVMTSPDGATWTTRRWQIRDELSAVVWGNNQYVAVGNSGLSLISQDGITWSEVTSVLLQEWALSRIRFLNGTFFAVGRQYRNQTESNALFSSADGIHWSSVTNAPPAVADIAGGNGQRVIMARNGIVYRSLSDNEWQPTTLKQLGDKHRGGEDNRIVWNGNMYVALQTLGYGTVLATSTDGVSWGIKEFGLLFGNLTWNGHAFMAVGNVGIATTTDGGEWRFADIRIQGVSLGPMNTIAGVSGKTLATTYSSYQGPVFLLSENGEQWGGLQHLDLLPPLGKSVTYSFVPAEVKFIGEKDELATEKRQSRTAGLIISFATSGLSLLLYVVLQVVALRKTTGVWKFFGWLPTAIVVPLVLATVFGLWQGANLWPLGIIFVLPLVLGYLLVFNVAHWLCLKSNKSKHQ